MRDIPVRALKLVGLTWSGGLLWYSEAVSAQLVALDVATEQVQHRVPCAGIRGGLTTMKGNIVQVVGDDHALRVIDPDTGQSIEDIPNPRPGHRLGGLEATSAGLWIGYPEPRVAELRDPDSLDLIDTVPLTRQVQGVTASDHYLAYSHPPTGTINLVDIAFGREVASYDVAGSPTGIAWDGSRVWYCDAETLQIRSVEFLGITR